MTRISFSHVLPSPRRGRVLIIALAVLLLLAPVAQAEVFFVDAVRPDDLGDGLSWGAAKQTIAAAVDASLAGDTILVKYGTYPIGDALVLTEDRLLSSDNGTHLDFAGALPDPLQTVVQADGTCRVLTITGSGVTGATRVRGLRLTGGNATNEGADPNWGYGGGVYIAGGATPILEECHIEGNLAGTPWNGWGGGIGIRDTGSGGVIRFCRIAGNTAADTWYGYGGGISCETGTVVEIHDCEIVQNLGSIHRVGGGGGIFCQGATVEIHDCDISENVGSGVDAAGGSRGGGIHASWGTVSIRGCTIDDNRATRGYYEVGYGGGLYLEGPGVEAVGNPSISGNIAATRGRGEGGGVSIGSGPKVRDNAITGNTATTFDTTSDYNCQGRGGGIKVSDSNSEVTGNFIVGNIASLHGEGWGGGIHLGSGNLISRNVLRENVAGSVGPGWGGGLWSYNCSWTTLENNDFIANANTTGAGGGEGSGWYHQSGGVPTVRNNIFYGHAHAASDGMGIVAGVALTVSNTCFHDNPGGHVNANVTSVDEVVVDPSFTSAALHDYTLAFDSPCIEAGHPDTPVPEGGGWRVDIGAFEYLGARHRILIEDVGPILLGGRVRAMVDLLDVGTLNWIEVIVHPGVSHPLAPGTVHRWYEIIHDGEPGLFDLTLSYDDDELGAQDEATLCLWRHDGVDWEGPKPASQRDLAENWVQVAGQTSFSDWVFTDAGGFSAVGPEQDALPALTGLSSNYPNPFNPRTVIEYRVAATGTVRLAIHDLQGRLVRTLANEVRSPGRHEVVWDGCDSRGQAVSAGVYLCRLEGVNGVEDSRKLVLVK